MFKYYVKMFRGLVCLSLNTKIDNAGDRGGDQHLTHGKGWGMTESIDKIKITAIVIILFVEL